MLTGGGALLRGMGYTDGGEDGNPDDGSRRSDESCCSGKWTICRSYWDEKKFLVRFRFTKNIENNRA